MPRVFIFNEQISLKVFILNGNLFKKRKIFVYMVDRELLKEVAVDQRISIIGKELGIPRSAIKRVSEVIGYPHVVVISGIRRCGKSTLLRQIINKFYNDDEFLYINFEDERLRDFDAGEFNKMYEVMISLFGKKSTIFMDEIQNVEGFELFVRRFHEQGFKIFITGSNANLLSRELGTKLTGRYVRIDLHPFSFLEFLKMENVEYDERSMYQTEKRIEIMKAFDDYLRRGGMPEFLRYDDGEILLRTYEDIVLKDIVVRYGLENVKMIRDLYGHLISHLSDKFSYNSLRKIVGAGSTTTIQNYIHYLEEANFCSILQRYEHSLKKQIISSKKFYLTDHGFVHFISTRLTKDKGKKLENVVLNHLRSKGEIMYFEMGGECDFITIEGNEVTSAIQSTWKLDEENRTREVNGLLNAMKEFGLEEGIIVTYDTEEEIVIDDMKIHVVPAWKWIMSIGE